MNKNDIIITVQEEERTLPIDNDTLKDFSTLFWEFGMFPAVAALNDQLAQNRRFINVNEIIKSAQRFMVLQESFLGKHASYGHVHLKYTASPINMLFERVRHANVPDIKKTIYKNLKEKFPNYLFDYSTINQNKEYVVRNRPIEMYASEFLDELSLSVNHDFEYHDIRHPTPAQTLTESDADNFISRVNLTMSLSEKLQNATNDNNNFTPYPQNWSSSIPLVGVLDGNLQETVVYVMSSFESDPFVSLENENTSIDKYLPYIFEQDPNIAPIIEKCADIAGEHTTCFIPRILARRRNSNKVLVILFVMFLPDVKDGIVNVPSIQKLFTQVANKYKKGWFRSISLTPDGRVISGSIDNSLRLWDIEKGEDLASFERCHEEMISAVAVTPDGKKVVSGSRDNTIRVWERNTGKEIKCKQEMMHEDFVETIAVTPDGKKIVSGSWDCSICIWDINNGKRLSRFYNHNVPVYAVAVTPDGKKIVSGSRARTVKIWDLSDGNTKPDILAGHSDSVRSVAISPDGKKIVSGSDDKTIRIWNISTKEELHVLKDHSDSVRSVAISPDGKKIVSGSDDHTVKIWDLESGEEIKTPAIMQHDDFVNAVAWTPDGTKIVSCSTDDSLIVWNPNTGEKINHIKGNKWDIFLNDVGFTSFKLRRDGKR